MQGDRGPDREFGDHRHQLRVVCSERERGDIGETAESLCASAPDPWTSLVIAQDGGTGRTHHQAGPIWLPVRERPGT